MRQIEKIKKTSGFKIIEQQPIGILKKIHHDVRGNIWLIPGDKVEIVEKLKEMPYYLVEINNCFIVVPVDAVEVKKDE